MTSTQRQYLLYNYLGGTYWLKDRLDNNNYTDYDTLKTLSTNNDSNYPKDIVPSNIIIYKRANIAFKDIEIETDLPSTTLTFPNAEHIINTKNIENFVIQTPLSNYYECSFSYYKPQDIKGIDGLSFINSLEIYNSLTTNKIIYIENYGLFQIQVNEYDNGTIYKSITAKNLAYSELSVNYGSLEILTESDIESHSDTTLYPNYTVTFYNATDGKTEYSLLHRILNYMPTYSIDYVDDCLKDIKEIYSWSNVSIWNILQDIQTKIGCIFLFNLKSRKISVVSSKSYCTNTLSDGTKCYGRRFGYVYDTTTSTFVKKCLDCGSTTTIENGGIGIDTCLSINTTNLAEEIQIESSNDNTFNCYTLKSGDDTLTNLIGMRLINGDNYLWQFNEDDMSEWSSELKTRYEQWLIDCANNQTTFDEYWNDYNKEQINRDYWSSNRSPSSSTSSDTSSEEQFNYLSSTFTKYYMDFPKQFSCSNVYDGTRVFNIYYNGWSTSTAFSIDSFTNEDITLTKRKEIASNMISMLSTILPSPYNVSLQTNVNPTYNTTTFDNSDTFKISTKGSVTTVGNTTTTSITLNNLLIHNNQYINIPISISDSSNTYSATTIDDDGTIHIKGTSKDIYNGILHISMCNNYTRNAVKQTDSSGDIYYINQELTPILSGQRIETDGVIVQDFVYNTTNYLKSDYFSYINSLLTTITGNSFSANTDMKDIYDYGLLGDSYHEHEGQKGYANDLANTTYGLTGYYRSTQLYSDKYNGEAIYKCQTDNKYYRNILGGKCNNPLCKCNTIKVLLPQYIDSYGRYNLTHKYDSSTKTYSVVCSHCGSTNVTDGYSITQLLSWRDAYTNALTFLSKIDGSSYISLNNKTTVYDEIAQNQGSYYSGYEMLLKKYTDFIDYINYLLANNDSDVHKSYESILSETVTNLNNYSNAISTMRSTYNLKTYLGNNLFQELFTYKRESQYSNSNFTYSNDDYELNINSTEEFLKDAHENAIEHKDISYNSVIQLSNLITLLFGNNTISYKTLEQLTLGNYIYLWLNGIQYQASINNIKWDFNNITKTEITLANTLLQSNNNNLLSKLIKENSDVLNISSSLTSTVSLHTEQITEIDNTISQITNNNTSSTNSNSTIDTSQYIDLTSKQTINGQKVFTNSIVGNLEGNASTSTSSSKLTNARTITYDTDVTGTMNFDGSTNVICDLTLDEFTEDEVQTIWDNA